MKIHNIFIIVASIALGTSACNTVEVTDPVFEVTPDKTTVKVGEAVTFNFGGEAVSNIRFYSGEINRVYANRDRVTAENAVNQLSFISNVTATGQANNLSLLVSNDFTGIYDSVNILKATWIDVTSKAKLGTTTTNVASGNVDVSAYRNQRDTLFVAYRYKSTPATVAANVPRAWTVSSFIFSNVFPDSSTNFHNTLVTDLRRAGFQTVSLGSDSLTWTLAATTLTFRVGKIGQTQSDDDWAISNAFKLSKVTPDYAITVQNSAGRVNNYIYRYNKPGTYKATFVVSNTYGTTIKETFKEVTITVTP
jgi:plastocyanin